MAVRILEDHVVNQIAAGEVVERPASVVRELLQNALDAGAGAVDVRLRGGGLEAVRVIDDGVGMNRDDAMMSLERHATSKILRAEDLSSIATLGFRGEALPSIAAVSRFELRTRLHHEDEGTRIRVEGGTLRDVGPVGCPPGTQVDVRSLFYNLPARRKFLRAPGTELSHAIAAVAREVLIRPELDAVVRHEERDVLRAPRVARASDRVTAVLGDEARGLLELDEIGSGVRVWGFVSPSGVHRATAAGSVFLYVNDRYVADPLLRRAVNEAYRDRVPRGRYPLVVLRVELSPGAVDVNVHPTKTEVRFADPHGVGEAVVDAVRQRVASVGSGSHHRDPAFVAAPGPLFAAEPARSSPAPTEPAPRPEALRSSLSAHPDDDPRLAAAPTMEPPPLPPRSPAQARAPEPAWRALVVIGPSGARWLVASFGDALVVVDRCEARRVLGQRAAARGEPPFGPSQRLLAPARVAVGSAAADGLEARQDELAALGVDLDRFAPGEVAVRGLPQRLGAVAAADLVAALARADAQGRPLVDAVCEVAAPHVGGLDAVAARTLLATLEEEAVAFAPPVAVTLGPEELLRRLRGAS